MFVTALDIFLVIFSIATLLACNIIAWRLAVKWMRSRDMLALTKEALFVLHRSTVDELHQAQQALYDAASERERLRDRTHKLQRIIDEQKNIALEQKRFIETLAAAGPPDSGGLIDDKTASLVRLAVSNNQENEQHVAAMLACRRIAARLGK
jgi:hypothetical protein